MIRDLLMPPHVSASDDHDVARSSSRPLPLQRRLQVLYCDLMARHRARRLSVMRFIPPQPVYEHTSAHDATALTPVMDSVRVGPRGFLVGQAVVVLLGSLVREMLQAVPLTSRLSVDIELVVHGLKVERLIQVDLRLAELFAVEARELDIVERPVELDVFAGLDLAGGSLDDGGGEEVDCCSDYC